MKKFLKEFKEFISRGNIIDLAVAVVIGGAFSAIVTSLVNDIIMPLICAIFGKSSVGHLNFVINGTPIYYGNFLQAIIDFLIIAFFVFTVVKILMKAQNFVKPDPNKPTKEEKRELIEKGVNLKDKQARTAALKELRDSKIVVEEPKPTTEELLTEILAELKKNNEDKKK